MKPRYLLAVFITVILVLYPLSLGPYWVIAALLGPRNQSPLFVDVGKFYAPISYAYQHSPAAYVAIKWYWDLWSPVTERASRWGYQDTSN